MKLLSSICFFNLSFPRRRESIAPQAILHDNKKLLRKSCGAVDSRLRGNDRSKYCLIIILSLFISFSAIAKEKVTDDIPQAPKTGLAAKYSHDIQKIEKYLNAITTLAAPFEQESSDGGKATGIFYLSRPGRLRWDYAPPTPILIVAKGSLVAYYDKELDEVSHVSLDDTLAGFLTRQKISFGDEGVKILGFEKKNGEIQITIAQNSKEEQGNLTMVFSEKNMDLLRMEVVDSIGKDTIVRFTTLAYNKPLDKELFVLPRVKAKLR